MDGWLLESEWQCQRLRLSEAWTPSVTGGIAWRRRLGDVPLLCTLWLGQVGLVCFKVSHLQAIQLWRQPHRYPHSNICPDSRYYWYLPRLKYLVIHSIHTVFIVFMWDYVYNYFFARASPRMFDCGGGRIDRHWHRNPHNPKFSFSSDFGRYLGNVGQCKQV